MYRFQPLLMKTNFSQSMMCSVVSPDDQSMIVTALFRCAGDYGGLIFYSEEPEQHKSAVYPASYDYADTILTFTASYEGVAVSFSDVSIKPAVSINTMDGETYYATMGYLGNIVGGSSSVIWNDGNGISLGNHFICWNTEIVNWTAVDSETGDSYSGTATRGVDYEMDYTLGIIYSKEGGGIPYNANVSITFQYHSSERYTLDFSNLYQGEHPDVAVQIPCNNIKSVVIPVIPNYYIISDEIHTGRSDKGMIRFTDWTVTGGELGESEDSLRESEYCFAEGYDDEYWQNPERMIQVMNHLGYRKSIDLYIGASHYYDIFGIAGTIRGAENQLMITNAEKGINAAFEMWLIYFIKAAVKYNFTKLVISISMESLHVPDNWRQKMFNGIDGASGWEPPTHFYSPTNPEVRNWYTKVCRNVLDIVTTEGMAPHLQLGEPWWWWQEFAPGDVSTPYEGRPPCFYDFYTVQKFKKEMGYDLPIFKTSSIDVSSNRDTLLWLQEQLGKFSNHVKNIVKEYDGNYTVLFFPPSVLETDRVPEAIRIVNVPKDKWKYPNLDYIQIEDYDWLIYENLEHKNIFTFAEDYFGYPKEQTDYFCGFCWSKYTYEYPDVENHGDKDNPFVVDTATGQQDLNQSAGPYVAVNSSYSSPYNAVSMRSETYVKGDKIYIKNNGPAGIAIVFVTAQWGINTLVSWMNPGDIVCLTYNGWEETVMWSVSSCLEYGDDGVVIQKSDGPQTIPFEYQWGLIENACRYGLKRGFQDIFIWAGTQIRRDCFIPGKIFWHVIEMYYEKDQKFLKVSPYYEQNIGIKIDDVYIEDGWHDTGMYQ